MNKHITKCYINAASDRKTCIFIMNCFLKFNQTEFLIFHIPDEIFRLIIEYYYNYCISQGLCKEFKCIQNFKTWFDTIDQELTKDIYHHCLNPNCHRESALYQLIQCTLCVQLTCAYCIYPFRNLSRVLKLCYLCRDKITKIDFDKYDYIYEDLDDDYRDQIKALIVLQ